MLRDIERRVLEAIDVDGLLSTLADLIAIRSLGGQENVAQEYVAGFMARLGMNVDVWALDFDALRRHPAFSMEIERPGALGVAGTMGENDGQRLILNGHVDVVPVGDEANWRYPPWQATVANERVYGRGACDMKGGLACALHAARAIHDAGVRLPGQLLIESVVGEEDGGVGTLAAVLRGYRADGAVVLEPTELVVAPAQAGALSFRVKVPGRSAHGCVREEGVSAVEKFLPIYQALMALERERNQAAAHPLYARYRLPYALCIGKVEAGDWPSSVADWLVFQGRYGVAPGEDLDTARHQFEETIARAAQADSWLRDHPPLVEWWGGQFAPASIPAEHPLVGNLICAFVEATGRPTRVEGMTYGADMRLLVNEGHTPTVLFGPGNVRHSHQPDEFVSVDDLVAATRTLALMAIRFCGGAL
ncbi:MAG: ArgE/DapE family deacylase [Anaerolineae bacterium]|nr:MAG: ArgE/DapE family deacylase [Anaerolineae bacterium]